MNLAKSITSLRTGFAPAFWIANSLELFERLAFYGAKAVLAYYLANKVGLHDEAATLTGWFSTIVYSLPIVAGVFVDRYGFRKTLMTCFAIFAIGYFSIGLAGMEYGSSITQLIGVRNYVIIVLLLTAIGGSLIKPCIVGTVAKTSTPESKPLGFSIYYTLVNFGGALGPIVALNIRKDLGIEYVLMMSSATSALLFLGTFLFFKEIENTGEEDKRTFAKVFGEMVLVFRNFKFISFLIIFSGFWLMFWQIFYLLPFYATEVLKFENFELLETVDAAGIIILTIPMAALVKKWKPINAMILGFVLASLSWLIIGSVGTVAAVVIGVFLYALGEATQTPRFYEYVSSLAPANQVGTFMGFAFLPVAIGSLTAGYLADWLRITFMQTNPSMMWFVLTGFGLFATVLILVYNSVFATSSSKP
ncbi:MAG: MFS transporter [Bacteroidetes bacterium]|nr:MFS transporter [Bacteroidota bacterium]